MLESHIASATAGAIGARFMTFAETLAAYPNGLSALARASSISYSTIRRIRDTEFANVPREHLFAIARASGWDVVLGMSGLDAARREGRLVRLYRRATRYPECGHSVCSQNLIENGIAKCIHAASRRAGLLLTESR